MIKNFIALAITLFYFVISPTICASEMNNISFVKRNLSLSLANQRVAIKQEFAYKEDEFFKEILKNVVYKQNKFEVAIHSFSPVMVEWGNRDVNDLSIIYTWRYTFKMGDKGLGETALGLASIMFTLGTLPTLINYGTLWLDVNISKNNSQIFKASYKQENEAMGNLYSDNSKLFGPIFADSSDILISNFLVELDENGALEK